MIHAGVGVFQNIEAASSISPAVASTGLANAVAVHHVRRRGDARPDWSCVPHRPERRFQRAAPTARADRRSARRRRTSRCSIRASGSRNRCAPPPIGPARSSTTASCSACRRSSRRDAHQQGDVDLNFDPTTRFALADEGDRPVFVDPSAIVPSTGAIATVGSRVSPAFQHVWAERSDLTLASKQVSINLKPVTANPRLQWDATYTLLDARETFSGFTSTAGNPFDVGRGPGLLGGRHTLLARRGTTFRSSTSCTSARVARVASGARYTPMIAGDVNGDGMLNDRAFIADPVVDARYGDWRRRCGRCCRARRRPSRRCLERQLNTLAARGSCQAPWTVNGGLIVKFNPQKIGLPKRATVTLTMQNPLALADLALHARDDLRGWGQNIPPDQNLLFVRGFDPSDAPVQVRGQSALRLDASAAVGDVRAAVHEPRRRARHRRAARAAAAHAAARRRPPATGHRSNGERADDVRHERDPESDVLHPAAERLAEAHARAGRQSRDVEPDVRDVHGLGVDAGRCVSRGAARATTAPARRTRVTSRRASAPSTIC